MSSWRTRLVRAAIDAGVGNPIAQATQPGLGPPLIALGMAAFLAAVTRAPLTAFIIVMEMVDGHAMVLSLMAAAMLATLVSRMITRPLYDSLADHMVAVAGCGGRRSAHADLPAIADTAPRQPVEPRS